VTTFPVLSPSGEYQDHESQYLIQQHFDQEKLPVDPPEDDTLTLTAVDPNQGLGQDAVTLTGTGFTKVVKVSFGSGAATDLVIVSATELTCTTPDWPAPESVDVTVTTGTETATLADGFTWIEV
jgi:hypothetical protein